ncbi:hypothetical protein A2V68_02100 [candidate division Kazan bacterium RBG_13_50_9]|uniref:Uncharacterized protein n=1 Tax=candidate division Kazan bacterium RBG_13_50_9 TaxID=1798535 RepID=A0A1F4NRK5_UNCK3|nr:MAG: hypothetical protein A2V68_02100 [candidate division Kazan bacterium RBG_13_50_9]
MQCWMVVVYILQVTVFLAVAWCVHHYTTFHGGRQRVGLLRGATTVAALAVFSWCPSTVGKVIAAVGFIIVLLIPSEEPAARR